MPPYVPRKRAYSPTKAAAVSSRKATGKASLLQDADHDVSTPSKHATQKLLDHLNESDESSLSDADSSGSEDSPRPQKQRKVQAASRDNDEGDESGSESASSSESDDAPEPEAMEDEWDDFIASHAAKEANPDGAPATEDPDSLELTLDKAPQHTRVSLDPSSSKKKGPSKIERQIRTSTHCLHVQYLMYHNFIRNDWCNNQKVQNTLIAGLPEGSKREVEKWKSACDRMLGKVSAENESVKASETSKKGKGKKSDKTTKSQRDWAAGADVPDEGDPSHSNYDPTSRLLLHLSSFWRQRFVINAPGLRKQGYKSMERLRDEGKAWQEGDVTHDSAERIASVRVFDKLAKKAEGSRDLGAQLFVAMLRGLGMEVRLVSNLQPAGFGWSKAEEADPAKKAATKPSNPPKPATSKQTPTKPSRSKTRLSKQSTTTTTTPSRSQPQRSQKRDGGGKDAPIDLSDDSPLSSPPSSDSEASVVDVTFTRPIESVRKFDRDLPFPVYWAEVLSPVTQTWIPVDPIVLKVISNKSETHNAFEPRGAQADRAKQVLAYVVAFSADNTAKDVTTRYLKKHMWPGKTKGTRMPVEKVPIYNKHGKIRKHEEYDWFKDVMSGYTRADQKPTKADEIEDATDLKAVRIQRDTAKKDGEETLQGYKNSAEYVLERHLRREEALLADAKPVRTFWTGKGEAAKSEPVYRRDDVVVCRTVESWHKEGREVKEGEQPLKHVPMRAVTTIRKREIEENERETGEKMKQGLYSWEQCDWIIPPPIVDGVIPKNAFGNMDVYVPTMVPRGATHVPLKGSARVCRKLGIEHAEACTGFEFGNRRAVPVLTGVVVANENKKLLIDAWKAEEVEKRKKEDAKREKLVLGMWKKLLAGLRVVERVRREYGDDEGAVEKAVKAQTQNKKGGKKGVSAKKGAARVDDEPVDLTMDLEDDAPLKRDLNGPMTEPLGGGFFPDGMDVEIVDRRPAIEDGDGGDGGGFILDDEDAAVGAYTDNNMQSKPAPMKSMRERLAENNDNSEDANEGGNLPVRNAARNNIKSKSSTIEPTAKARRKPVLPSPVSNSHEDSDEQMSADSSSEEEEDHPVQRSKYFESSDDDIKDEDESSDDEPVVKSSSKRKRVSRAAAARPTRGRVRDKVVQSRSRGRRK